MEAERCGTHPRRPATAERAGSRLDQVRLCDARDNNGVRGPDIAITQVVIHAR